MAKARLEISFGPGFSETRTLTWNFDGLVVLPTAPARLPTVRTSSYAQTWFGREFIGNVPHHLLWFTVYCNENTSFLDLYGDRRGQSFLIGQLTYAVTSYSRVMDRRTFQRYYIQMLTTGVFDE